MNDQPPLRVSAFDGDRAADEHHRQRVLRDSREADEIALRDRERELSERQHREPYPPGAPHHSSAGSIPIHQPVASRIPAAHSPGGLLADHGSHGGSAPLGGPQGPGAAFGGPPMHNESSRPLQHVTQTSGGPPPMFAPLPHGPSGPGSAIGQAGGPGPVFGGPLQQDGPRGAVHQLPFGSGMPAPGGPPPGQGALQQGQQPILNDALTYLDQVKIQFQAQPDVYNKFLDIMKDFKSQTIDTPGVINRVSDLFAGHPNLIQGFNTFLPPGYRIECGFENNPNNIRVTTPSGSTIHSIGGGRGSQTEALPPAAPGHAYGGQRAGAWQPPLQRSVESPEERFSVPAHAVPTGFPPSSQGESIDNNQSPPGPARVGASNQNGAVPGQPPPRNAHTPTPTGAQPAVNGSGSQQNSMEKRGPVEFNHAISYVNKIKNRFQDKPEIYKQFLEILQTYQREQKPIQDVYSQVTTLFHTAPDLLEDFKQFLPESAASNRGGRPDDGGLLNASTPTPQPSHPARDGPKMPPVGNFAPPASATKEGKKRPRADKQAAAPPPSAAEAQISALRVTSMGANKRAKLSHKAVVDGPVIEPTLVPVMPEPLAPLGVTDAAAEDVIFFDRVKKHVANRTSMNEFMKLCNLYVMDLIDNDVLIHKANQFIGGNPELLAWFKNFVNYKGSDEIIENKPEPPSGRVSLSNCRGYGPSYRLLPRRERLKPCSGRDELCNEVLNDQWASHPTWASEDSGFVAHRKNGYEEGLHRIEEERHDYDFYIEANQKCIQLLEPIAQQMLTLTPAERQTFRMPPGLGGQSTSIYKRVLKKIYGIEKGAEVVNELFSNPFSVVPIVMARLKQKDEEWRFTQREWEKVWQTQTENMHLKSLDHMGIQIKSSDKRTLSAKHLVDIIKTKHEEQRRARSNKGKVPRFQFTFQFDDQDVLLDLLRMMFIFATNGGQHNAVERRRILEFFEFFIPQFFDLPEDLVQNKLADIEQDSADEDDEDSTPADVTSGRSRRNGKRSDLLRGVLDPGRNGSKSRTQKEDSAATGSKETTPDVGSANEEEMLDAPEDSAMPEMTNDRWLPTVPRPTVIEGENPLHDTDGELKADAPFNRTWYNFYCNQNIYVFFSVFNALYKRLVQVKNSTGSVSAEIERERAEKPAKQLKMVSEDMRYFEDSNPATFWARTVELIEDFVNAEIDENRYQDVLRRYYLQNGWTLYTIQDLLKSLCRLALACNNPDTKGEKTKELVKEFLASRQREETSYQAEISARKFAEKCIKDGEMFVICWHPLRKEATIRWLQKDETTFYMDEMALRERWQYYISSYMRIEPTEGVIRSRLQKVLLERNLPSGNDSEDGYAPKPLVISEGLILRICLNSSKIVYEKGTSEYFIYNNNSQRPAASEEERKAQAERQSARREFRDQKFREKMVMNNAWMKNMSQDEVQNMNEKYRNWVDEGVPPLGAAGGADAGAS